MALQQRLSQLIGPPALALALACAPLLAASVSAEDRELRSGLARFALDSGDPSAALRYSRDLSGEAALMVRARALIITGSDSGARGLLEQLASGQYYRGRAALLLAGIAERSGEDALAREHLETAARLAHGDDKQQALYRLAELRREAGQPGQAGKVLASMEPGYWAALGYMNLAADYGRRDRDPSRALVALRVALSMADADPDSDRSQELKSRLLVRAGHLAYEHEDHDKAISFLEKVPLDSYSTPQGLYLHGLALSASGNQRAAMQSWHRAKKFPLAYPGVANAWLGTGRGYDLSGYLGQAGEAYLAANASFEGERVTLRKLADTIREKGAYHALVRDALDSNAEWFLADSRMLTQPRTAYLLRFMERPAAQAAVRRVAELEKVGREMAQWEDSLVVFRDGIEARLGPGNAGGITRDRYGKDIEALKARIATLMEHDVSPAQQDELRGVARTLADVKSSFANLDERIAAKDRRLASLLARTDQALEQVRAIRKRVFGLRARAEAALDEVALAYVEQEDQRMALALDRTEQQIAHLYEYLALQNLERGEP